MNKVLFLALLIASCTSSVEKKQTIANDEKQIEALIQMNSLLESVTPKIRSEFYDRSRLVIRTIDESLLSLTSTDRERKESIRQLKEAYPDIVIKYELESNKVQVYYDLRSELLAHIKTSVIDEAKEMIIREGFILGLPDSLVVKYTSFDID